MRSPTFVKAISQNQTVLIVDDEPAVRLTLRTILEERFRVVACGSGAEAIRFTSEHPGEISAAFVDYAMPEIDGSVVCAALRRIDATISLIGFSSREDAPFSSPLRAKLLKKNLSPAQVIAAAEDAVRSTQQSRAPAASALRDLE